MLAIYISILLLLLYGVRIKQEVPQKGYLSKEQCNCIKGFFIVVVFARHIAPYLVKSGYSYSLGGDKLFHFIDSHIGQLLVVMFLFYSGYGVMESFKKKGIQYIEHIPKRRILTTLINFDVAIVFFLILNLVLNIDYPIKKILFSFIGWESIGNSNWYIFVILCCYLSTYLTFKLIVRDENSRKSIGGGEFFDINYTLCCISEYKAILLV